MHFSEILQFYFVSTKGKDAHFSTSFSIKSQSYLIKQENKF